MIKSLKIQNFQSHERSTLEFSEGVNIIVGNSDSGKSSIIRTLRWLVWNRPSGNEFLSYWGDEVSVKMELEENKIVRYKGKQDKYLLEHRNGKNIEFKAFGTSVPEEISRVLNINEINLQYQLDAPFLLSISPGQVAEHFNKVAKLDQIDRGLFNINKAIRELESDRKYKVADLETKQEELKQFEHLDKFEAEVEVLENMQNQLRSTQSNKENLDLKIYDYKECEKFIDGHKAILVDEDKVNFLLDSYHRLSLMKEEKEKLTGIVNNLFLIEDDIEDAQEQISDEKAVNKLLQLYNVKKTAEDQHTALFKLLFTISNISNSIKTKTANLASLEATFKREMGDVCILCGNKLK